MRESERVMGGVEAEQRGAEGRGGDTGKIKIVERGDGGEEAAERASAKKIETRSDRFGAHQIRAHVNAGEMLSYPFHKILIRTRVLQGCVCGNLTPSSLPSFLEKGSERERERRG
jgi:hypothetical protein